MTAKLNENAYKEFSGQNWPTYQEYLDSKFPNDEIKQEILNLEIKSAKINVGFDYLSLKPLHIDFDELTIKEKYYLTESKTFCMLPWIHMHAYPDGRVYPCCLSNYWHQLGDLRKNTMEEIWNQEPYKLLRQNMLTEKESKQCSKCYEQESNGFFSMRHDANRTYGHLVNEIALTKEDGTHPEFKIRYWDVRFSNLCNFRCRSCGPVFSSNWYNDHVKLYNKNPDSLGREMARIEYTAGNEQEAIKQMQPHIPYLEQVYFAGGEPLIMKEHYYLLEKLIELGKTDTRIIYNTNFSELRYKDKHVFDYWKHFTSVSVGASLDGMGPQGELIRKGQDWTQTEANRIRMKEEVPHVDFFVNATISSMNLLHILEFHKKWVSKGLIKAQDFNVNICQSPDWYRVDIFPTWFKEQYIYPAYEEHIAWLEPYDKLKRAINGFRSVVNMLKANDASHLWPKFCEETAKLDRVRNENFWDLFPEYEKLKP